MCGCGIHCVKRKEGRGGEGGRKGGGGGEGRVSKREVALRDSIFVISIDK